MVKNAWIALLLVLGGVFVQAQDRTNGSNVGFPQGGDFHGSGVDSIQTNNGNLHIEIPLWNLPGRGVGSHNIMEYDSKGWYVQPSCNSNGVCSYTVSPDRYNTAQMAIATSGIGPYFGSTALRQICNTAPPYYNLQGDYLVREYNGGKHHFVPDPVSYNQSTSCWVNYSAGTVYADDGSGWVITNGVQISKSGGIPWLRDTNGNSVGATDTLGRSYSTNGSYTDSNGNLHQITVTTETVSISTHLCGSLSQCVEQTGINWTVPHIITLPNGLTYDIEYVQNDEGEIKSITLPSGAVITYQYEASPNEDHGGKRILSRTITNESQVSTWTYSYTAYSTSTRTRTTTVTDPLGNQTVYTFQAFNGSSGVYNDGVYSDSAAQAVVLDPPCALAKEQDYDASGNLLKTVTYSYTTSIWQGLPNVVTTTLRSGQVSKVEQDYETMTVTMFPDGSQGPPTAPITWGNVKERREYDFGNGQPGALLRKTDFAYLHTDTTVNPNANRAAYLAANIADRPTSKIVYDGSGNVVAQTKYYYDEGSLTATSGAPGHDYTHYSTSNKIRGNLTRESRWRSTDGAWLDTKYTYDDLGNRRTVQDPKGNTTQYVYTDSFADTDCVSSGSTTNAFLTQTIDALGHTTTYSYYSCTGQLAQVRSPNDQANNRTGTVYTYDAMLRASSESFPDGGSITYNYNGDSLPLTVTTTRAANPDPSVVTTTVADGLGRIVKSLYPNDPCGSDEVDTNYDLLGRVYTVTNPYRTSPSSGCSAGPAGTVTYTYDALGRKVVQAQQDGSKRYWCYDGFGTAGQNNCNAHLGSVANGTWIDASDELGNDWQSTSDALGRLSEVMEPSGSSQVPSMETDYAYDTLNNLRQVDQYGGAKGNSQYTDHQRQFTYDSLSQLIQSFNVESGWVCYGTTGGAIPNGSNCTSGYDANGNLAYKTDARGVRTNYTSYDALNRLTGKTYTVPSPAPAGYAATPSVAYTYDQGSASQNPIGHRTGMTDGTGQQSWTYESMGRVNSIQRTITTPVSTQQSQTSYGYNLDGALSSGTFSTGTTFEYNYDAAGRQTAVTWVDEGNVSHNFITRVTYSPGGQLAGLAQNNGSSTAPWTLSSSYVHNSRLQLAQYSVQVPSQTIVSHTLCYVNCYSGAPAYDNGNLQIDQDNVTAANTATYKYDTLNRLSSGQTVSVWGDSYTYDPFGNLYNKTPLGSGYGESLVAASTAKNQLSGVGVVYDADGNVLQDNLGTQYTYDAEDRLASAAGWTYSYDGDGNRVLKTAGGTTGSTYWYGAEGLLTDEQSVGLNPGTGYPGQLQRDFYLNGHLVLRDAFPDVSYFLLYDQVGSNRVAVNLNWNPATGTNPPSFTNYYPYGGYVSAPTDDVEQKFTGKLRDSESGDDYFGARYYSSMLARFLSPDWSAKEEPVPYAKLGNPQSLNLYAYVGNNPTVTADPDGHEGGPGAVDPTNSGPSGGDLNASLEAEKHDAGASQTQQSAQPQTQQQNGDPTLPTEVQPAISPLDKALGPTPSNMLMVVTGDLGELAELGKALTGAAETGEALSKAGTIEKLTADAKELYPKLAEKADQLHHVIPKYLGGAQDGALAKIPAAYHQMITNAFRTLAPYGQAISRTTQEVTNIVKQVYSMFPLP